MTAPDNISPRRETSGVSAIDTLLQNPATGAKTRAALNVLLEAPYFYKTDDEELFLFLRRYTRELNTFLETSFGWQLVIDAKCARLYKPEWHNNAITPTNRDIFNFTRRDECIAFMLLLEFFEMRLEEEAITIDDPENLRFRFGDLLVFTHQRFRETFPEAPERYSDEEVRRILRQVMPTLERYRFLLRIRPPSGETITPEDIIYECLPALWHYNATAVTRPIGSEAVVDTPPVEEEEDEEASR